MFGRQEFLLKELDRLEKASYAPHLCSGAQAKIEAIEASQNTPSSGELGRLSGADSRDLQEVKRKVPGWFNRPHQKNSQILIGALELMGERGYVPYRELERHFASMPTFRSHYTSMDRPLCQGRVFEERDGMV